MSVSPANTIIVYRSGDNASEAIADAYVALHDLDDSTNVSVNVPTGQKIPISCSSTEILSDEDAFNTQVLNPILNAIIDLENYGLSVWCVVLGFNIPAGFIHEDNIISSTSRIARIHHNFDKKTRNKLFDRKDFKLFDEDDKVSALIVSRIDGINLDNGLNLVNLSDTIKKQLFVNGTFYLDAYSDRQGRGSLEYQNFLLEFQSKILPLLNLNTWSTTFLDPYIDTIIPSVKEDSFIWSWFTDRGSSSFFKPTNAFRFFAYNGDNDGAYTLRSVSDRRWCGLYIRNGYAATAGSMSSPGYDGLLQPSPFFTTLLRGGTLGEAYTFSLPYWNWTLTLIGDPLMKVSFPAELQIEEEDILTEEESWRKMFVDVSKAMAYSLRKTDLLEEVRDKVVLSTDVSEEVDLLRLSQNIVDHNDDSRRQGQFDDVVNTLLNHIEERISNNPTQVNQSVSQYLLANEIKMSELVFDAQRDDNKLIEANLLPEGYWEFEFILKDESTDFAFYHFELYIADTENFSNIILEKKSIEDISNWMYEKEKDNFVPFDIQGIGSNFVGRRIKYIAKSSEYLQRSDIYYFRIRQRDQNTIYDFRESSDIICT